MTRETGPVVIEDGATLRDADAWGFCRWCAFEVAINPERVMVQHQRRRTGSDDSLCPGSWKTAEPETPRTAKAVSHVSLYKKDFHKARTKCYWQRVRQKNREEARKVDLTKKAKAGKLKGVRVA